MAEGDEILEIYYKPDGTVDGWGMHVNIEVPAQDVQKVIDALTKEPANKH